MIMHTRWDDFEATCQVVYIEIDQSAIWMEDSIQIALWP